MMQGLSVVERGVLGFLSLAMVAIGVAHFVIPEPFIRIVPPYLPAAAALVYVSGACEIAGGLGVLLPGTRKAAAWGLVALYLAVFPANIHMAMDGVQPVPGVAIPVWAMWVRLPFQALLVATAWWFTRKPVAPRA